MAAPDDPAELAAAFRDGLPGKLTTLRLGLQTLATDFAEGAASIRRVAHRLKGTGAAFGYPEVTAAALTVMLAADAALPDAAGALIKTLETVVSAADGAAKPDTTILIIDDDPEFRLLLETILRGEGRRMLTAGNSAEAEAVIETLPLALIVLDLMLADTDGRSLLLRLRENPHTAAVPIIVVSGKTNPEIKAECFALGADGYFEKPVQPQVVAAAVTARLEQSRRSIREARTDALTGLPNRAAFGEAFGLAAVQARRANEPLTVAILDLDNFKRINDTYGHGEGDQVLKRLATLVPQSLRQTDLLARWGGEEFVLLFPGTDPLAAKSALDKARAAFKQAVFRTADGRRFSLSFSAGVAPAEGAPTAAEAVSAADRFLYLAKDAGRDRIFSPLEPERPVRPRVLLVEDDELIAELVTHRLTRNNLEVVHFADGAAAAAALTDANFGLALLDIQLPGMNGFELLHRLRRQPGWEHIPVLMLTALAKEAEITRALALGANDYLVKPFSPTELLARVHRLLKRR